jgi:hypothetical protein
MALVVCPIHGPAGYCIYSPALLELLVDGTLPEIVTVEVKDTAEEEAFFRFNVTPTEAAALPIVDGRIPFDLEAMAIMERLNHGCGRCFADRRQGLQRR